MTAREFRKQSRTGVQERGKESTANYCLHFKIMFWTFTSAIKQRSNKTTMLNSVLLILLCALYSFSLVNVFEQKDKVKGKVLAH